eukprot:6175681-Pleurochrysis_carterae.AAC.4
MYFNVWHVLSRPDKCSMGMRAHVLEPDADCARSMVDGSTNSDTSAALRLTDTRSKNHHCSRVKLYAQHRGVN